MGRILEVNSGMCFGVSVPASSEEMDGAAQHWRFPVLDPRLSSARRKDLVKHLRIKGKKQGALRDPRFELGSLADPRGDGKREF